MSKSNAGQGGNNMQEVIEISKRCDSAGRGNNAGISVDNTQKVIEIVKGCDPGRLPLSPLPRPPNPPNTGQDGNKSMLA